MVSDGVLYLTVSWVDHAIVSERGVHRNECVCAQREMNNVVAEIVCDIPLGQAVGAGAVAEKYTCYCQELTSCILSQSSNTGRNQISLAN